MRLQEEESRLRARTDQQLAAIKAERGEVLSVLNAEGRSAEDLAQIAGLPPKRVRTILRSRKKGAGNTATSDNVEHSTPSVAHVADKGDETLASEGSSPPIQSGPGELVDGPAAATATPHVGDTHG